MLVDKGLAVTLVERLPMGGGQDPERPGTDKLFAAAEQAGVSSMLATLAVRWDGRGLETLGVEGATRVECNVVVIATGTRPATRGELNIGGDRCAGILPGSAAVHLVDSGVLLGRRPVILGGGDLASSCAERLGRSGAEAVTLVAPEGPRAVFPQGVRVLDGWEVRSVHGRARVASVVVARDGVEQVVPSDALVLAHRRVPMRNVEGAIFAAPGVVFCHSSADPKTEADAWATSVSAVEEVTRSLGRFDEGQYQREPVAAGEVVGNPQPSDGLMRN